MSEPEGNPGRRPPTIELTAKEIDKPAAPPGAGAAEAAGDGPAQGNGERAGAIFGTRVKSHAISALLGAVAMLALIGVLRLSGFVPSRQVVAPAAPAAATDAASPTAKTPGDIAARHDKIEGAIEAQRTEPPPDTGAAEVQAQAKSLGDSLAALSRRVDDIAAMAEAAQKTADAAAAAADAANSAGQANLQRSDVDALTRRIAALESVVKSLSDQVAQRTSAADDRAVRLSIAAEALSATLERGAPYPAELAAVEALGADQSLTARLAPFAAGGLPSAAVLARELTTLTPAMQRASDNAAPGEASFLGRLETSAQKLVRITPLDAPPGHDPAAVIARIDTDAARTDIPTALADIGLLPDSARSVAADWVKKAEARQAALAASRRIAADALAALSNPAAQ